MKLAPLHDAFIAALQRRLPDWRFVAKHRHFQKAHGNVTWLFHIAFINHETDFDAVADVAVEFLEGKKRACIFGAELGNIHGPGQRRYSVASAAQAALEAERAVKDLQDIGLPFLEAYSNPSQVIQTLEAGGTKASLISPIAEKHPGQIAALKGIQHAV